MLRVGNVVMLEMSFYYFLRSKYLMLFFSTDLLM